jgi:hypothetical protein
VSAPVPAPAAITAHERHVHAWADAPDAEGFRLTVQLVEPSAGLELSADTTPSPEYLIRAARGRVLMGAPARLAPALADAAGALAGVTMTPGFTRRVAAVAGDHAGAALFVDAAIEIARLARQVTRLPAAVIARHRPAGAAGAWRLDLAGWADLPGSCYTYRPESAALFAERTISSPVPWGLYDPPAGATRVFNRSKVGRLERGPGRWRASQSMFDEVHSFRIWVEIDPAGPTVVDAGSLTPRLPYQGLCDDPQVRIRDLVGQPVDAGLRRRLGGLLGGPGGCAQLYDLTTDLVKLLEAAR